MLSGLICAFVAADCDDKYGAVTAALSCMKSAGGLAASDMAEHGRETNSCYFIKPGNAAYRDRLIDAVYHICDGDYELMLISLYDRQLVCRSWVLYLENNMIRGERYI